MSNLILFASADAGSRANFARTVTAGVAADTLRAHLPAAEIDLLRLHYGESPVPIWGVWTATDDRQVPKWQRVLDGDLAAFSRLGGVGAHARIVHTFRSPALASAIWDDKVTPHGPKPYELMFALKEVTTVDVGYASLNASLPGWSPSASIREFNVLDPLRSAAAQALLTGLTPVQVRQPWPVRVDVEMANVDSYETQPSDEPAAAVRREAALVSRYTAWSRTHGAEVCRHRVPLPEGGNLFTDLYDATRREVIEAKSSASRNSVRMALGQVLDYARLITEAQHRAVLLPERPRQDLEDLLIQFKVAVIWPTESTFERVDP